MVVSPNLVLFRLSLLSLFASLSSSLSSLLLSSLSLSLANSASSRFISLSISSSSFTLDLRLRASLLALYFFVGAFDASVMMLSSPPVEPGILFHSLVEFCV